VEDAGIFAVFFKGNLRENLKTSKKIQEIEWLSIFRPFLTIFIKNLNFRPMTGIKFHKF
jgi:hypothetical protein